MVYIFVFFISFIFMNLGEILFKKRYLNIGMILMMVSVIIVSLFAGLRDSGVGTDMTIYGDKLFQLSIMFRRFSDFLSYNQYESREIGYLYLNYIVSRFSINLYWFYSVMALLVNFLIYFGIFIQRKKISITLAWTSYLFIFYVNTFNLMRQSIAMAILFFGISLYLKKTKNIYLILSITVAYLFHSSALLIGIFMVIILKLLKKKENRMRKISIIIFSLIILLYFSKFFLTYFISIDFLSEKYNTYLSNSISESNLAMLIFKVPILLFVIIKAKKEEEYEAIFFASLAMLDSIFYFFKEVNSAFIRISYYFYLFQIISIPYLYNEKAEQSKKIVFYLFYFSFLISIWWYRIVILGNQGVFPYSSKILGI